MALVNYGLWLGNINELETEYKFIDCGETYGILHRSGKGSSFFQSMVFDMSGGPHVQVSAPSLPQHNAKML